MQFFKKLFKKNILDTDLLKGAVEVHCHLLPGVDDGLKELKKSLAIVKWMEQVGYRHICLTPHIMTEWPKNGADFLQGEFKRFEEAVRTELKSDIGLSLAAEYMLDANFEDRLEEQVLSYDGVHILVETSYFAPSPQMELQLYTAKVKGMIPLFAHPERCLYMDIPQLMELKERGQFFQLNLMSLCGAYGPDPKKKAEQLFKRGAYDFVGCDTHSFSWLKNGMKKLNFSTSQLNELKRLFDNNKGLLK